MGLPTTFQAEVAQEVAALVGPGMADTLDFDAVEVAVRRQVLRMAARVAEQRLNADLAQHAGTTRACACGQLACYAGRRTERFTSVLGELTLERAYYHCVECDTGFCPRSRALGLHGTSLSTAVTRLVGVVGALVSFAEGSELLRELADAPVTPTHVERAAEALGREIATDERRVVEPVPSAEVVPTLYLSKGCSKCSKRR